MRLIKQHDQDLAAEEAMRGGFIGAVKYCSIGLFAGAILQATSPRFRAIRPPQKGWLMVAIGLGGFGNGADTAFTNYERRDRELQIRVANKRRHDILYGNDDEKEAVAASLSTPTDTVNTATSVPATPASAPA